MVNDELRVDAFEHVTDERARAVYDMLCRACENRDDGMTDADQLLVGDYAYAEQLKRLHREDVLKRGIGKNYSNGRQSYYKENPSIKEIRDQTKLQADILDRLKLSAKARKATPGDIDDDFDTFD